MAMSSRTGVQKEEFASMANFRVIICVIKSSAGVWRSNFSRRYIFSHLIYEIHYAPDSKTLLCESFPSLPKPERERERESEKREEGSRKRTRSSGFNWIFAGEECSHNFDEFSDGGKTLIRPVSALALNNWIGILNPSDDWDSRAFASMSNFAMDRAHLEGEECCPTREVA